MRSPIRVAGDTTSTRVAAPAAAAAVSALPSDRSALADLYGSLASISWTPHFEIAITARRQLGLEPAEAESLNAILISYRRPGLWESISQKRLADRRGVSRTTLNRQLSSLRSKGMIAARTDEAHRPQPHMDATLFYCAEPYLAALASVASRRVTTRSLSLRLYAEANRRFRLFVQEVRAQRWNWEFGSLSSFAEIDGLTDAFASRHGLQSPSEAQRMSLPTRRTAPVLPSPSPDGATTSLHSRGMEVSTCVERVHPAPDSRPGSWE